MPSTSTAKMQFTVVVMLITVTVIQGKATKGKSHSAPQVPVSTKPATSGRKDNKQFLDGLRALGVDEDVQKEYNAEYSTCLLDDNCKRKLESFTKDMGKIGKGFVAGNKLATWFLAAAQKNNIKDIAANVQMINDFFDGVEPMISVISNHDAFNKVLSPIKTQEKAIRTGFFRTEDKFYEVLKKVPGKVIPEASSFQIQFDRAGSTFHSASLVLKNYFEAEEKDMRGLEQFDQRAFENSTSSFYNFKDIFIGFSGAPTLCDLSYKEPNSSFTQVAITIIDLMALSARNTILIGKVLLRKDLDKIISQFKKDLTDVISEINRCLDKGTKATARSREPVISPYVEQSKDTCMACLSVGECAIAGSADPATETSDGHPPGCFTQGGNLFFNEDTTSSVKCSTTMVCWCKNGYTAMMEGLQGVQDAQFMQASGELNNNFKNGYDNCMKDPSCSGKLQLDASETTLQQVGASLSITTELISLTQKPIERFVSITAAKLLTNLAPFLGVLGPVAALAGTFVDSDEKQYLIKILETVNQGFKETNAKMNRVLGAIEDLSVKMDLRFKQAALNSIIDTISMSIFNVNDIYAKFHTTNSINEGLKNDKTLKDILMANEYEVAIATGITTANYNDLKNNLKLLEFNFIGDSSKPKLCLVFTESTKCDRMTVVKLLLKYYVHMMSGVQYLMFYEQYSKYGKLMGTDDGAYSSQGIWEEILKSVATEMENCDTNIRNREFLSYWKDDAMRHVGEIGAEDLGDPSGAAGTVYDQLSNKYYWREWLVGVLKEEDISGNIILKSCYGDVVPTTTIDDSPYILRHPHQGYVFVVTSVDKTKTATRTNLQTDLTRIPIGTVADNSFWDRLAMTLASTGRHGPHQVHQSITTWSLETIFSQFPADVRRSTSGAPCAYPLYGLMRDKETTASWRDSSTFHFKTSPSSKWLANVHHNDGRTTDGYMTDDYDNFVKEHLFIVFG